MADDKGDALAALKAARKAARRAVDEIQDGKQAAYNRQDYEQYDRCVAALPLALDSEHYATQRLIAGIIDPPDGSVKSLKDATGELEDRIQKFKDDAARLNDLASCLSILTHVILLIAMV